MDLHLGQFLGSAPLLRRAHLYEQREHVRIVPGATSSGVDALDCICYHITNPIFICNRDFLSIINIFDEMHNISKTTIQMLKNKLSLDVFTIEKIQIDKNDKTTKFLFLFKYGHYIESVLMYFD